MFCQSHMIALSELRKDKEIIICRPDKGRGVVIMNRDDYVSKMDEILNDDSKFKEITAKEDPAIRLERIVNATTFHWMRLYRILLTSAKKREYNSQST
jgi:hypothetical protein